VLALVNGQCAVEHLKNEDADGITVHGLAVLPLANSLRGGDASYTSARACRTGIGWTHLRREAFRPVAERPRRVRDEHGKAKSRRC
jgi:hypothetical protein